MKIRMIGMLLVTVEILRNDSVLEVSCTVLDISQMTISITFGWAKAVM